ncbi:unnamed protein product [Linum tenue]|uniref:Uncharacterized protein n=1 Tax=Linum tenue TaxID=586396 RepID=A0AAV0RRL4_9ROSI|nr:unnamed protein product [Linum tenue]
MSSSLTSIKSFQEIFNFINHFTHWYLPDSSFLLWTLYFKNSLSNSLSSFIFTISRHGLRLWKGLLPPSGTRNRNYFSLILWL